MVFGARRGLAQYMSLIPFLWIMSPSRSPALVPPGQTYQAMYTTSPDAFPHQEFPLEHPLSSVWKNVFTEALLCSHIWYQSIKFISNKDKSVIHKKSGAWSHPERGALVHFHIHGRGNGQCCHIITGTISFPG